MNDSLVRLVAGRFESFARPFLQIPGDGFAYHLKIKHTQNVLDFAETISRDEALPKHVDLAARLAALVHDVGRFPQFKQYQTFRDSDSENHAALSITHILREKLLADIPSDIRRLVLGAVYVHNKRALPALASTDLRTVAQVLRDSDKLDIYAIMIGHYSQENPEHPEVGLNVPDDPLRYSDSVLDALFKRETCDYRAMACANDFKMMAIGWLYDLNFRTSCRLLKHKGYLDTLFGILPPDEKLRRFRQQIDQDLARRLDGA